MGRTVIPSDVVSINGLPEQTVGGGMSVQATSGLHEMVYGSKAGAQQRLEPNPYVAKRTSWFDPRDTEIEQLRRLLSEAKTGAVETRRLLSVTEKQRDVALYERDIAVRALAELVQHFINAPPATSEEENPAVRAVRVMQNIGAAR